jgi:hypothetical protein
MLSQLAGGMGLELHVNGLPKWMTKMNPDKMTAADRHHIVGSRRARACAPCCHFGRRHLGEGRAKRRRECCHRRERHALVGVAFLLFFNSLSPTCGVLTALGPVACKVGAFRNPEVARAGRLI